MLRRFLIKSTFAAFLVYLVFTSLDENTQGEIECFVEAQAIPMTKTKNGLYLFAWELFGGQSQELKDQAERDSTALANRLEALELKRNKLRAPASSSEK